MNDKIYIVVRVADDCNDEWYLGDSLNVEEAIRVCDYNRKYDYKSHTEVRMHDVNNGNVDYCNYSIVY